MTGVALITGGQQGIGFAIADALVNAGFTAVLAAHVTPDDPIVIKALRTLGPMAHYVQHDVTHIDGVAPLLDRIEADHGPVTTFISNAGVGAPVRGDMLDLLSDNYDVVMNVNLRGAFFLAQGVARRMRDARREISHWRRYDYCIVNDDLDAAFLELQTILAAERLKRLRRHDLEPLVRILLKE